MADYIQSTAMPCDQNDDSDDAGDHDMAALSTTVVCTVPPQVTPTRFDKVLAQLLPSYSRSRLQRWIDQQQVTLNAHIATSRILVYGGEQVRVTTAPLPETQAFQAEPMTLDVVYEDATLFVINKPAGLVVHPAAGNWSGTLLNGLLFRDAQLAQVPRAGIVHRLDKDTSGLMVVARTLTAHTDLVRQLQARTVQREYLALVWGALKTAGTIHAPIARDPRQPLRMAVVAPGKAARTHYTPLAMTTLATKTSRQSVTLVRCRLDTGRTHQIRVHMQHLGFPLVGDPVYSKYSKKSPLAGEAAGDPTQSLQRQALHAWQLGLRHPDSGELCQWQQALPDDFQQLLDALAISFPGV